MTLTNIQSAELNTIQEKSGHNLNDFDSLKGWKDAVMSGFETELLCELSKDVNAPENAREIANAELSRRFVVAFPDMQNAIMDALSMRALYDLSVSEYSSDATKEVTKAELQRRIADACSVESNNLQ